MKRFKKFLVEEATASAMGTDDAGVGMPKASTTGPSYTPPAKIKKQNSSSPQIENEENEDEDDEVPTWDEWFEKNPLPRREDYDLDGDGVLNGEEEEAYQAAWELWIDNYYLWLRDNWRLQQPIRDWDSPLRGLQDINWEEWWRNDPWNQQYENSPDWEKPDPPRFDKEDYKFWWDLWKQIYGRDPSSQELYDYVWRIMRGKEGELPDSWWSQQNQSGMGQ